MERIISDISEFIFMEDTPEICDIIFIPGSSKYEMAELASRFFHKNYANDILPAGKFTSKLQGFPNEKVEKSEYQGDFETEWEFNSFVLQANGVPAENILLENQSTNTKENAFFSRKTTDSLNLSIKKAILCCQAFHARRVFMTYQWAYPEVDFLVCPVTTQGIGKNTWQQQDDGIQRVLGEVEKCGKYFLPYFSE